MAAFAKAFADRWRIVEVELWDNDPVNLIAEVHLTFKGAADGAIAFGALKGFLDIRYGAHDGSAARSPGKRSLLARAGEVENPFGPPPALPEMCHVNPDTCATPRSVLRSLSDNPDIKSRQSPHGMAGEYVYIYPASPASPRKQPS